MAKKNFIPTGGLNKDTDKYLLPDGDYIVAKNIVLDSSSSGGAGSIKTLASVSTMGLNLGTGLINPEIKAAVVDNAQNTYVLVKGDSLAKIWKIDSSDTLSHVVTYTHAVSSDFEPDLKIIGDALVWNYREKGVPLSWYVKRTAKTVTDLTEITFIKRPPNFVFSLTPLEAGTSPSDLIFSTSSFSEESATASTIATITITDASSSDTHTVTILSAVDGNGADASARFVIDDSDNTDYQALLKSVGIFNYATVSDRTFTINIRVTDSEGLTYTEPYVLTIISSESPTVSVADANIDEDAAIGAAVVTATGTSGGAVGDDSGCTYAITAGNTGSAFAIDASTGAITVASALNYETLASYNLTVQITNAGGFTQTDTTAIAINNTNEAPIAANQTINVNNNTFTGTLAAPDPDAGDTLTFTIVGNPSNGTVTILNAATGSFRYEPDGSSTSDSFTFKATDNHGQESNVATVTVNVGYVSIVIVSDEIELGLITVIPNTAIYGRTLSINGTGTARAAGGITDFAPNNVGDITLSFATNGDSQGIASVSGSTNPTSMNGAKTEFYFSWSLVLSGDVSTSSFLTFEMTATFGTPP